MVGLGGLHVRSGRLGIEVNTVNQLLECQEPSHHHIVMWRSPSTALLVSERNDEMQTMTIGAGSQTENKGRHDALP